MVSIYGECDGAIYHHFHPTITQMYRLVCKYITFVALLENNVFKVRKNEIRNGKEKKKNWKIKSKAMKIHL